MAEDITDVPIQAVELMGVIMAYNAQDQAHIQGILLGMAERDRDYFAQALIDFYNWIDMAIPYHLRPMAIQQAMDDIAWKVTEAEKKLDIVSSRNTRGAM